MGQMMAIVRSVIYYPVFYGISTLLVAWSAIAARLGPGPLRQLVTAWTSWHRWCVTHLLGIRIVVEGDLPTGAVLVAVKHESFFEAIDMPRLLSRPSVFAKQELFAIPVWGRSARVFGLIPVARNEGARALRRMIADAKERVAEGRPLVIFPEGTRAPHGERLPLQAGFAGAYKLLGLPVVPLAVNSGPLYHRWIKRPGTIIYRIGETIPAGLPREEVEARVLEAINALN